MKRNLLITVWFLVSIVATQLFHSERAYAAWLDPAWGLQVPVTISNPGGSTLNNFQVHLSLDSTFDFANAKVDGSDLRFTSDDGTTLIPFWIESWNAVTKTASIWVNVPTIPSSDTTVYLYFENQAAASASNGAATFEFFDDFESGGTVSGYYDLGAELTVMVKNQPWENSAPHTLSVVQNNSGGYTYWGYYGLQSCNGGVGLAYSNDLVTWTKYFSNPLFLNGRWPSVLKVGSTFYMIYTRDFCFSSYLVLATSTDGINFTDRKTIVRREAGLANQNPNLFYNPNDGKYYIYWYRGNDSSFFEVRARSAATPEGLDDAGSEIVVLQSTNLLAAPNMLFRDGTYFLSVESYSSGQWISPIYSSTSPTSGFSLLPGNPVIGNGSACNFQHVVGTELHDYYCKYTGSTWTLDHRVADLTAGRLLFAEQVPDPDKWTVSGGSWIGVTDTQQDGTVGSVLQGSIGSDIWDAIISSYQGGDYVLEAYGKQISGRAWGLGVRGTDQNNLYTASLYEDLDGASNLYVYNWVSGSASELANAAVGVVNANTWYKLSVKAYGDSIDVYKDNVLMLQTSSSQYGLGAVALYGEQNAVMQFNNVLVRKFAAIEPTTTVGDSANNPVPTTTSLSPLSATAGGAGFTLAVNGTNFVSGSTVRWNGSNRMTTYVSSTQLTAAILAADIASAGTASVTVFNAAPGGGTSNAQTFTINNFLLTTYTDDFNRADGDLGINWTKFPGFNPLTISDNKVVSDASERASYWSNNTFSNDQYAEITAVTLDSGNNTNTSIFVRCSPGAFTGYFLNVGLSTWNIYKVVNGSATILVNDQSRATSNGTTVRLTIVGRTLSISFNGKVEYQYTDTGTLISGGYPGLSLMGTTATADNWVCGDVSINNPVPTTTSLSPLSATAGGAGFTLTVNGTNFVSGSTVRWNGSNRTTTYVSSTQLTAAILAADIASAGTASVTVFNAAPGGGTSNAQTFTIGSANNPVPTTTSLSPLSATAGGAGFTLTVNGTNFVSSSTVRWNGSNRTTTYVSSTQLTAAILAADIASAGTASVTVFNAAPGGGTSNAQTFTIDAANNPVPTTTSLSPLSATAGGAGFTLTVNGTNFVSGSTVRWNGSNRTTTYVSSTQLTAAILAADIASAGTASVTVFNAAPGGGTSNAQTFTIGSANNPVPTTTSLSPLSATAGGAGFTLTVNGTNFVSSSTVRWNGSNRTTTYVSSTQLTAAILAADIASAGTASVTVFNAAPGGGTSNAQTFTIDAANNPVPTTTSLSPLSATAGGAGFTLTVNGTNFVSGSTVRWNGSNRTTTYVSSTQLTAAILAADIASAGTASVTVFNAAPGGGTSNAQTFTINNFLLTTYTDDFNRADGDLGINWTKFPGFNPLTISDNKVVSDASERASYWSNNTFSNDQYAEITAVTLDSGNNTNTSIFVRCSPGAFTGYFLNVGLSTWNIYKVVNGSATILVNDQSRATSNGTTVRLTIVGRTLSISFNGKVEYQYTDTGTLISGGYPGLSLMGTTATADNWVCGDVSINNPVPTTTSLSPLSATAGGAGFTLTVNGTNFVSGSTVRWNGSNRTTTYVSSTQLTAAILAADIASAGTASVTVFNAAPGGGTSNAQTFTIDASASAVAALDAWTNLYSASPNNSSVSSLNVGSFTVGSGSQRLLLVSVVMEIGTAANPSISAAYGGTALTQIGITADTQREIVWMGYLKEAQVGTGTKALTISYSGASGNVSALHVKWASYTGVNQSNPIVSSAARNTASTSVTFGSAINYVNNGMTVVVAGNGGTPATGRLSATPSFTAGTATTTNAQTSRAFTTAKHTAAGSYSSSTAVTWTGTTSSRSGLVVVSLQP